MIPPPFLVLAGPTAVGKSEIALLLSARLNGEIVSVDSMQVYRGMDIGTAKPSLGDRSRVPHHLIDMLPITEVFDAAKFVQLASSAVADIQARSRLPILCGGTGLYFKALFEGLGNAPPGDPVLRTKLEATALADLLQELAQLDPATYERIDQQNPRRVIRALEVIRLTGRPFSKQRAAWSSIAATEAQRTPFFGLLRSSGDLRRRIDTRVEEMFTRGLIAETERLKKCGLENNPNASQALGYKQVLEHLAGARPLSETTELVKIRTRQYAKRQTTWFRRQFQLNWIPIEPDQEANDVAARIAREFNNSRDKKCETRNPKS
ncbi:MAG TPA: tRNA (adenosine(37)-N6)-dimethylallyltransferase MiaA [Candidatus Limnocylindrales bacterium]|jgi:tRNA dimethylallyltransferase|nr:tRNA (adenosine(37)-N6)-dimethylallyltransferase MiaA [Candidatus Limnocylindrales bacterium]